MPEHSNPLAGINAPCQAHLNMQELWDLVDDLNGGTLCMRAAGQKWLPPHEAEESTVYQSRLARSILYNAYRNTVENLVSRPFSRPISIRGTPLPGPLEPLLTDCDKEGTDLTQFARQQLVEGINCGIGHILVDMPATKDVQTLADELALDLRPYFCHVSPKNLIGWKVEYVAGAPILTAIRIMEYVIEEKGEYQTQEIEQIRLITRDSWSTFRKIDERQWVEYDSGINTLGEVPLITWYVKKTGLLTGSPALEDLAWLNLAHWQSYSDQRNILTVVRAPTLVAIGMEEEKVKTIIVGPRQVIATSNKDAQLYWLELQNGESIEAGWKDLSSLEARMEVLGHQPLMENVASASATSRSIDEHYRETSIQSWIRALEGGLDRAVRMAGAWRGVEVSEETKFDIFSDFGVRAYADTDMETLLALRKLKDIDQETMLEETRRRRIIDENTDIPAVIAATEDEKEKAAKEAIMIAGHAEDVATQQDADVAREAAAVGEDNQEA